MNKFIITLALLLFANNFIQAAETASVLETGDYLLVYQVGKSAAMKQLKVSFKNNADGTLCLSCSDASFTPTMVTEARSTFQFGLINSGHKNKALGTDWPYNALYFVGGPMEVFSEHNEYRQETGVYTGTAASITSRADSHNGISGAESGTFLLYKMSQ
jgi:hypothetical protein